MMNTTSKHRDQGQCTLQICRETVLDFLDDLHDYAEEQSHHHSSNIDFRINHILQNARTRFKAKWNEDNKRHYIDADRQTV